MKFCAISNAKREENKRNNMLYWPVLICLLHCNEQLVFIRHYAIAHFQLHFVKRPNIKPLQISWIIEFLLHHHNSNRFDFNLMFRKTIRRVAFILRFNVAALGNAWLHVCFIFVFRQLPSTCQKKNYASSLDFLRTIKFSLQKNY